MSLYGASVFISDVIVLIKTIIIIFLSGLGVCDPRVPVIFPSVWKLLTAFLSL